MNLQNLTDKNCCHLNNWAHKNSCQLSGAEETKGNSHGAASTGEGLFIVIYMDPEKSGDNFPSRAGHRETADKELSGYQWEVPLCLLCSYALSQPAAAGVCGDELRSCCGPLSPEAQLTFYSDPPTTAQCRQEHLEAGTVVATEFLGRRKLGYVHSTEAISIRPSSVRVWGATGTAGPATLPDWPCLLCSLSLTAIVSTR